MLFCVYVNSCSVWLWQNAITEPYYFQSVELKRQLLSSLFFQHLVGLLAQGWIQWRVDGGAADPDICPISVWNWAPNK